MQLSRGKSSMDVLNAACPFEYIGAGHGVIFDADVYHRGGNQELGTVKVAFFFAWRAPAANAVESEEEEEEDEVGGKGKVMVKQEGAPGSSLD